MTVDQFKKSIILPWFICGLGAIFYCYEYFLRISPSVMTPELMRAYNLTGAQVGNLSAFYYHAYVPLQIIVGLFMDRYGPRLLLTFACFLCALGSYLFAGHHGLAMAEVGRFLVGFGSAFAFVGALKLATIWLPPNRFALISGIILCLGMSGAMMGDILLRSMVDSIGWRGTVYMSAIVGVFISVLLWVFVRDKGPRALRHNNQSVTFQGVLSGLYVALKNNQIWLNAFVGFLLYISLSAFAELWGIPYLEQARGLSTIHAAQANSMIFLGWAVGGPIWGWLSDHFRTRVAPLKFGSIGAIIMVMLLLFLPVIPSPLLFILLFVFGLFSSVQIIVFAICHEASHYKIAATAIAFTNMIVMIGGNLFQPFIGKLLDREWTGVLANGARIYPVHAYQLALSVIPIGLFIAIFLTKYIKETHCTYVTNE